MDNRPARKFAALPESPDYREKVNQVRRITLNSTLCPMTIITRPSLAGDLTTNRLITDHS